ncbi:MAG: hypothetical protein KBT03_06085 [Bacteroidales bacterium]|nr:hypothetical protein [Candidatus Scybalousia scybalohippi]
MGFEINMPDDLYDDLIRKADDDTLKSIVDGVSPELVKSVKSAMSTKIKHPGESKLVSSIKATKAKVAKTDAVISFVRPTGTDSTRSDTGGKRTTPIRNMEKAIYMNYGTVNELARPWLEPAVNNSEKKIQEAIQREFERRCLE